MTHHPSQPAPASTAALLAGYLHAAGVRHVFGFPGESVIDFMEAARHRGIQVVSAVREGTAAFMAEASAMAAGRPGSACPHWGPGRPRC
jgi:thiamine pyrophosphate-dependent acetolactate synthase large subunit-like protein